MNAKEILLVLDAIAADNIQEGTRNIQCSCFLAPWRKGHRSATDSRPSMGISIAPDGESKVHCFSCEYGGTFKRAVEDLAHFSGEDFADLIQKVGNYEDIDPVLVVDSIPEYDVYDRPKEELRLGEALMDDMRGMGHKYLFDRGFEIETLKEWESGYDRKNQRVTFPVRNHQHFLVGAVGRTVVDHQIKYFNYFGFDKSSFLFGENKITKGTTLIVVEGLLDTVKTWQGLCRDGLLDRYSVVGLLGSEASKGQCQKLLKYANEVVLFLDNDKAGWLGQNRLALAMQTKLLLKSVDYPSGVGSDPDDVVESNYPLTELFDTSKLIAAKRGLDWR